MGDVNKGIWGGETREEGQGGEERGVAGSGGDPVLTADYQTEREEGEMQTHTGKRCYDGGT